MTFAEPRLIALVARKSRQQQWQEDTLPRGGHIFFPDRFDLIDLTMARHMKPRSYVTDGGGISKDLGLLASPGCGTGRASELAPTAADRGDKRPLVAL